MEKLNYKDSISEIESIVKSIEENSLSVDELSEKVRRVAKLIEFCKSKLRTTEIEIEAILKTLE